MRSGQRSARRGRKAEQETEQKTEDGYYAVSAQQGKDCYPCENCSCAFQESDLRLWQTA
jgi:hypothetical protein